ncbi:DUF2848 family protein [Conexibacter woesei]|uniref:DUF2848 domain-containing protein n=1 Tax=Conexibacter woesei (strain DSM 14684 / CCUG 47730 / CIP 108061 / JCM 11494 / NBRC 100937 / ID131577) TaxID=469383 RepID=D3F6Y4_CONWI|nr:DUF2848 family protein [Conexibacter woesei]ADB52782.1 conserved hypothetical protein [Conexibacter woesei DSM 14684]
MEIEFEVDGRAIAVRPQALVVAGFTGRDAHGVDAHIRELAEEGVAPPPSVPSFYLLPPTALTRARELCAVRARTSGEAEIAVIVDGDERWVTLASDHTDRGVEALDIGLSKEVCSKPIAQRAWAYADVVDGWDQLRLRSWISDAGERRPYQDGLAASLLPTQELVERLSPRMGVSRYVLLTGTVPTVSGVREADHFWAELEDARRGETIALDYAVRVLKPLEVTA